MRTSLVAAAILLVAGRAYPQSLAGGLPVVREDLARETRDRIAGDEAVYRAGATYADGAVQAEQARAEQEETALSGRIDALVKAWVYRDANGTMAGEPVPLREGDFVYLNGRTWAGWAYPSADSAVLAGFPFTFLLYESPHCTGTPFVSYGDGQGGTVESELLPRRVAGPFILPRTTVCSPGKGCFELPSERYFEVGPRKDIIPASYRFMYAGSATCFEMSSPPERPYPAWTAVDITRQLPDMASPRFVMPISLSK